jgi:3'-phosphoadenosine 5'-phosphosulfate (PAPS) 3'-phosphatase
MRLGTFCVVLLQMIPLCRSFLHQRLRLGTRLVRSNSLHSAAKSVEYAFTTQPSVSETLLALKSLRPQLQLVTSISTNFGSKDDSTWALLRDGMQLDATTLEDQYVGKHALPPKAAAEIWNLHIEERLNGKGNAYIQCGGIYESEVNAAIGVVQRATNVVRSLQSKLVGGGISKADSTPVTIADLAIQALVLDTLHAAFPADRFVAEEDSVLVRAHSVIRRQVLQVAETASGQDWSEDRLYKALDLGSNMNAASCVKPGDTTRSQRSQTVLSRAGPANVKCPQYHLLTFLRLVVRYTGTQDRVWVLDPIDGTKGFLRGEHCCTALGLVVNGLTVLSVIGCPNLNLQRVLRNDADMCAIDAPVHVQCGNGNALTLFHPDGGSLYFAVTGHGE